MVNDDAAWESIFRAMSEEWAVATTFSALRLQIWEADLNDAVAEASRLKREGRWVSGPDNLLTVIGRSRDELAHSSAVAWLLTPTGQHGFGARLLDAILQGGWADEAATAGDMDSPIETVVIQCETPFGDRRADILVYADDVLLVVENKVGAPESETQCEDVYQQWVEPARDVRFLLLSVSGSPPATTITEEAAAAWRSMSYSTLATKLEDLMDEIGPSPAGAEAVRQYVKAIRTFSHVRTPFFIRRGGGHVRAN